MHFSELWLHTAQPSLRLSAPICLETTHHRAVGIRQELPELREQILLVLEEASNLRVHLLLRQRRRVVPSCLLGIALLLLPRERGEASEGHTNYLSDKF